MSILIDSHSRVIVQGITGREGTFHAHQMLKYGTNIVAGVSPKRAGTKWNESIPVFETVRQARSETGADATIIFVPPLYAAEAIMDAIDAEIKVIVCVADGIPVHDMLFVKRKLLDSEKSILIGPNCPGIITPGESKLGFMSDHIYKKGNIGIVSRSGSLSFEVAYGLTTAGMGQSTAVGVGGDAIKGAEFKDILPLFDEDPETEAIVLVGEIGGEDEENAATYIKERGKKPVVAYIAGRSAPEGKKMGHAGALIMKGKGTYDSKYKALSGAGVLVAETPADVPHLIRKVMG
jgi:succinyl-CoA synthetase alpha subunit